MTLLGIIGLLIDWRSDFVRMWPTILGLKFLTLAILFYPGDSPKNFAAAHCSSASISGPQVKRHDSKQAKFLFL